MVHGSSCWAYQTASRVQRRFAADAPKEVPLPISRGIRTGNEGAGGQPPAALSAESDVFRIPHVGMPAPAVAGAGSERVPVSTISDWPRPRSHSTTTFISLGTAGARACSNSTIGSIQAPRLLARRMRQATGIAQPR